MPAVPMNQYADNHRVTTERPLYQVTERSRRVADTAATSIGRRTLTSLEAITSTLQLSTLISGSYMDDSKGLFALSQALASRVSAMETALGRETELPKLAGLLTITSAEKNRYTADVMQAAITALEGCLGVYTTILQQQTASLKTIVTLTSSANIFKERVENDHEKVAENKPDKVITRLVTDYVSAMSDLSATHEQARNAPPSTSSPFE